MDRCQQMNNIQANMHFLNLLLFFAVLSLQENGKYIVTFHGDSFDNCTIDTDCPEQALCLKDVSYWSVFPTTCACSTSLSRIGETCLEITSGGWGVVVILSFALFLILLAICYYTMSILTILRFKRKALFSAVSMSILILFTACCIFASFLAINITKQVGIILIVDGTTRKEPYLETLFNVFLSISYFLVTLGILTSTYVFLDFIGLYHRFSHRIIQRIRFFGKIALGYYLIFLIGLIVLLAVNQAQYVVCFTIIPIFSVFLYFNWMLYVIVYQTPQHKDSPRKLTISSIRLLLATLLCGTSLLISFAAIGTTQNTPMIPVDNLLLSSAWIFFSMSLLILAKFLFEILRNYIIGRPNKNDLGEEKKEVADMLTTSLIFRSEQRESVERIERKKFDKDSIKKSQSSRTLKGKREDEGMEIILRDKSGDIKESFTSFVRTKFATEILFLYDACIEYEEAAKKSDCTPEELCELGHNMIQEYIRLDSPKAVNISHGIQTALLDVDRNKTFQANTFEQVKKESYALLKTNFYAQFIKFLDEDETAESDDGVN